MVGIFSSYLKSFPGFSFPSYARRAVGFIIALLVFLYCGLANAAEVNLKKVKFIPLWKPQAQFAGYYVAYELGFYKKYGLDVTILEGGPDYPPIKLLKEGGADFSVMWLSSAIQRRSEGVALVNICQITRRSALMLVVKKSSGIERPQDLQGKKVNLWEGDLRLQPDAFLRKYGLKVEGVPQSYTVNLFLKDGVDAVSAMWYNEYDTIINSGINPEELNTFFFSDYGLNFPEDGIYTLEETLAQDPSAAAAFVKGTREGWLYAFANPDKAVDIVLKYMRQANVPANRVHQEWMLARMKDLILPQDNRKAFGVLDKEDYERVCKELVNSGLIKECSDFNAFYVPADKQ